MLFTEKLSLKEIMPDRAKDIIERYNLKNEDLEFVRKKTPLNPDDLKIEEGERAAVRYINTADLDRDNEIVLPKGLDVDDFKKSPTVLYAHNYMGLPIGKDAWIKYVKGKGWMAKTIYAKHQLADDVYNLVKEKFLNTSSIGFIPLETVRPEDKGWAKTKAIINQEYGIPEETIDKARQIYTKAILLEHSDVPIPSNINALNVAVGKGLEIKSPELIEDLNIEIVDEKAEEKPEEKNIAVNEEAKNEKQDIGISIDEIFAIVKENKELKAKLEEMEIKSGAVLNKKNKSNLKNAQNLIQQVIDSSEPMEEEEKDIEIEEETKEVKIEDNGYEVNDIVSIIKEYAGQIKDTEEKRKKEKKEVLEKFTENMPELLLKHKTGKVM